MANADQLVCGKCGTSVERYVARCPSCAASLATEDAKLLKWRFDRGEHHHGRSLLVYSFLASLVGVLCGVVGSVIVYWKPVSNLLIASGIYRNMRTDDTMSAIFWRFMIFAALGFLSAFLYFRHINKSDRMSARKS